MAEVTMSLSELDKLRQDKDNAIKEKEAKIEEIQKLKEDLISVKSDKRTVRITKYKQNDYTSNYDHFNYPSSIQSENLSQCANKLATEIYSRIGGYRIDINSLTDAVRQACNKVIIFNHSVSLTVNKEDEIEFINFEDVKELLKKEVEKELQTELVTLRSAKKYSLEKELTINKEHEKELNDLKESLDEKFSELFKEKKNLIKEYEEKLSLSDKKILDLQQKIEDIISDKDTRKKEIILEEKISQLEKELKKEKERGILNRFFSVSTK